MSSAFLDMYLYMFKLALFRDGSHSGTDVCVVDWFLNMYVPWIPVAKINDKLTFLHRICGKSITALLDY